MAYAFYQAILKLFIIGSIHGMLIEKYLVKKYYTYINCTTFKKIFLVLLLEIVTCCNETYHFNLADECLNNY